MISHNNDSHDILTQADNLSFALDTIPLKSQTLNGTGKNNSGCTQRTLLSNAMPRNLIKEGIASDSAATQKQVSPATGSVSGDVSVPATELSETEGVKPTAGSRKRVRRQPTHFEDEPPQPSRHDKELLDDANYEGGAKRQRSSRKMAKGSSNARATVKGRAKNRGTRGRKEQMEHSSDESQPAEPTAEKSVQQSAQQPSDQPGGSCGVPSADQPAVHPVEKSAEPSVAEMDESHSSRSTTHSQESVDGNKPDEPQPAEQDNTSDTVTPDVNQIKMEMGGFDFIDAFPPGVRRGRRIVKPPSVMYAAVTPPSRAKTRATRGGGGRGKKRTNSIVTSGTAKYSVPQDDIGIHGKFKKCEATANYQMRDKAAVWSKILAAERKDRQLNSQKTESVPFVESMLYEAWQDDDDEGDVRPRSTNSNLFAQEFSLFPWNQQVTGEVAKEKNFEFSLMLMSPAQAKATTIQEPNDSKSSSQQTSECPSGIECDLSSKQAFSPNLKHDSQRSLSVVWHPSAQCWVCSSTDVRNKPTKATFSAVILGFEEARRQAVQLAASSCVSKRSRNGFQTDVIPAVFFNNESREWTATGVVTSDGGHHIEVIQRCFSEDRYGGFLESRKSAIQWLISVTTDKRPRESSNAQVPSPPTPPTAPKLSEQDRSLLLLFVMLIQQQQKQQQERQQMQRNDQQHLIQLQQLQQQLGAITGRHTEFSRNGE